MAAHRAESQPSRLHGMSFMALKPIVPMHWFASEAYRSIIISSSGSGNIINVSNGNRDTYYISGRGFPPLPAALLEYNESMHYVLYV